MTITTMNFIVFFSCHDFKIFNTIILFFMIYMMNNFFSSEFSSEKFLHYISMFPNIFIVDPKINIPASNYSSVARCFFSSCLPMVSTSERTVFGMRTIRPNLKYFFADFAIQ